jgi:hypothetical protein
MFALPNYDRTFIAPIAMPKSGVFSFEELDTGDKFKQHINESFADTEYLMPSLKEDRETKK